MTGKWIEVGGKTYNELAKDPKNQAYFNTAQHRKGNLYGKHGCSNAYKYVGQSGPFCGPASCPRTYPVRNAGEYRAAIRYSANADPKDQEAIRTCAERVRATGYKSGGNKL